jgi:hypothetical protein
LITGFLLSPWLWLKATLWYFYSALRFFYMNVIMTDIVSEFLLLICVC